MLPDGACADDSPYALSSKLETVEIQSFLDAQWQEYQESNPGDEDCPRPVKKARWAREHYYYFLQTFLQRKTLDSKTFAHRVQDDIFVPLLPVSSVSTEGDRALAAQAVRQMKEGDIEEVDKVLWESWSAYYTQCGAGAENKYTYFATFLRQEYFHILKYKCRFAKPRVPPTVRASSDEATKRRRFVAGDDT